MNQIIFSTNNIMNRNIYENYNSKISLPNLFDDAGNEKRFAPIVKQGNFYRVNWRLRNYIKDLEDLGFDDDDINDFLPNYMEDGDITMRKEGEEYIFSRNPNDINAEEIQGQTLTNFIQKSYVFEEGSDLTIRELYQYAIDRMDEEGQEAYVVLYYTNNINNNVRHISISQNETDSFEEFEARRTFIEEGNLQGSDAIQTDNITWRLDTSKMGLVFITIQGEGNSKCFFKSENIVGKPTKKNLNVNNCGFQVVEAILKDCGINTEEIQDEDIEYMLQEYKNIEKVLQKYEINYEIIFNSINYNVTPKQRRKKKKIKVNGKTINEVGDDWSKRPLYKKKGDFKYHIIYDCKENHFDLVIGDLEIIDNLYISKCNKFFIKEEDDYKLFMTGRKNEEKGKKVKEVELKYCFFDYETIIDWKEDSGMKAYSISYLILTESELDELETADAKSQRDKIKEWKDKAKCYIGWDCNYRFVEEILNNQDHIRYKFCSFNGANFDNYLLLEYLLKHKENHKLEYSVKDVFYNGSQLLNFKLNKNHTCFDLAKHLVGSLDGNCKGWKVNCFAKSSFNHYETQKLYQNDKDNFIKNITSQKLIDYNKLDVLSLAVIFKRYKNQLSNIPATQKYGEKLEECMTIGGIVWKVFNDYNKEQGNDFPTFMTEGLEEGEEDPLHRYYKDLNRCKVAGRVEMFNGKQEIFEKMASLDVCSLYPYVLSVLDAYYPTGEIIEFKANESPPADKMYFQYIDIDQTHLKELNLPQIYAEKSEGLNNWDKPVMKNYLLSNVMIELLDKYDCITAKREGFYFSDKVENYKAFGFLLDFMNEKNKQDEYKRKKDDKYNAPLRETIKLLSNAISGKVIEGLHCDKIEEGNVEKYFAIKNDENTEKISAINIVGDKVFFSYSVKEESIMKEQRPIYLGCLCYDYARRYMFEKIYSKTIGGNKNNVYTDTDALKCRHKDFDWKYLADNKVPCWDYIREKFPEYKNHPLYSASSKVYGSFENELDDNDYFSCFQKKAWIVAKDKKVLQDKGCPKASFKGVSPKSVILYGGEDLFDENGKLDQIKANKLYNESSNKIFAEGQDHYYEFSKKIWKDRDEGNKTRILTQTFRKVVRNSFQNVDITEEGKMKRNNYIKIVFSIKNINILSE